MRWHCNIIARLRPDEMLHSNNAIQVHFVAERSRTSLSSVRYAPPDCQLPQQQQHACMLCQRPGCKEPNDRCNRVRWRATPRLRVVGITGRGMGGALTLFSRVLGHRRGCASETIAEPAMKIRNCMILVIKEYVVVK